MHGTEEGSVPRICRNLYRLYVDTYECMGAHPDDDGIPCIMGFLPSTIAEHVMAGLVGVAAIKTIAWGVLPF